MLPNLIFVGLIIGRWPWAVPLVAVLATVLVVVGAAASGGNEITIWLVARSLILNFLITAAGALVHQALWRGGRFAWRRLRRRFGAGEAAETTVTT